MVEQLVGRVQLVTPGQRRERVTNDVITIATNHIKSVAITSKVTIFASLELRSVNHRAVNSVYFCKPLAHIPGCQLSKPLAYILGANCKTMVYILGGQLNTICPLFVQFKMSIQMRAGH